MNELDTDFLRQAKLANDLRKELDEAAEQVRRLGEEKREVTRRVQEALKTARAEEDAVPRGFVFSEGLCRGRINAYETVLLWLEKGGSFAR